MNTFLYYVIEASRAGFSFLEYKRRVTRETQDRAYALARRYAATAAKRGYDVSITLHESRPFEGVEDGQLVTRVVYTSRAIILPPWRHADK